MSKQTKIPAGEPIAYEQSAYDKACEVYVTAERAYSAHPNKEYKRQVDEAAAQVKAELAKLQNGASG